MEFGFVPRGVIDDLQDIGNWKSRAAAIDKLHGALRDNDDRTDINLNKFVPFLMTLVVSRLGAQLAIATPWGHA